MNFIKISYLKTFYGELIIGDFNDKICLCDWKYRKMRTQIDSRIKKFLNAEFIEEETTYIRNIKIQLDEYFNKKRTKFTIPLLLIGTDFQKNIWNELIKIPYGKTFSYLELAKKINNEKAVRAVASANGANAISILVPCHRIIGKNGALTGYAGGLNSKKKLLELENN